MTPFRFFWSTFSAATFMQHFRSSSPQSTSIHHLLWPAAVCFVFFWTESRLFWRSWQKSLHRGTHNPQKTECPLQTALVEHTLSIVCIYSLITIFMGILYTQNATLITSLLIMSVGEAGWVWGLFISETKLSGWKKKSSLARLEREIWACQSLFCRVSESSHSVLISISSAVTLSLPL